MNHSKYSEAHLEDAIVHCLINQHGYKKGSTKEFDASLAPWFQML